MAPVVAVTFVWQTMLNPQFGIVNAIGQDVFGWADPVAFLSQRSATVSLLGLEITLPVALLTVMAFETWRYFPFAFLFLTARISALPGDLEEAARMDGATVSQRFRYVVFPQLLPTVALLAVLRFIFTFNEFDDIYLLTGGAAGTQVVSVRVYYLLTARGDVGTASAQALVLALILVRAAGPVLPVRRPADGGGHVTRTPGRAARTTGDGPRRWTRDRVETLVFGVLRWVVIAVLVLVTLFPFYYMLVLSVRTPGRGGAAARAAVAGHVRLVDLRVGARPGGRGRPGLPGVPAQQRGPGGAHGAGHAARRDPRRVRDQPAGVLRPPPGQRAVPGRLPVPGDPARGAAVRLLLRRSGCAARCSALVVVYVAQTVPISIYMLRNYFETVPVSLEEAAAVDGASRWTIMRRISLPLAMPAVVSNALYVFMIAWNEFLFALLFLAENRPRWTVSLGLAQLAGSIEIPTTMLMAGSVLLTLPIVVLFFLAERLLVEGLTSGAEKG